MTVFFAVYVAHRVPPRVTGLEAPLSFYAIGNLLRL